MDAKQNLFYGFGEVAYSVAMADGRVQREERNKFIQIIKDGVKQYSIEMEYADLIFKILEDERMDSEFAYKSGIEAMELGSHYLSAELKVAFLEILGDIAASFLPVTDSEATVVKQFGQDLERMTKNTPLS